MPGNLLPDAEQLLKTLSEKIRPEIGPETGLIGIHTGGVWIAQRLHQALGSKAGLGTLDVSFYRDDYDQRGSHRNPKRSEIPFEVEGRDLIVVDDVLFTGRTIRAALNEIFDYGRPASIRLAVLVDRGGRELPISAQFTGMTLQVGANESIRLRRGANGELSLVLNKT